MGSARKRTYDPDVLEYLSRFDARLLETSEGRRILTRLEPKLFSLVYLLHHLTDENDHVSFADVHDDWFEHMRSWVRPVAEPREWRRAFVAPRSCGKSTMWYLVAPLWAGAHGFARFVAAFADSATQAETHLSTFKHELSTNALLREDFPDLCRPAVRARGVTEADNRSLYKSASGFVFAGKGIDSSSLGLKVGDTRPDVIIGDDLEPSESNYSAHQAEKRLSTLVNAILPLSERARVVIVGTVTMPGSLVHQLVRTVITTEEPEQWITDERITCYYYPPIVQAEDGAERSIWERKWPLEWLRSIRNTRSYRMNYANDPAGFDGGYWKQDDFRYATFGVRPTKWLLQVDPAVTTKGTSDWTGLAVVGHVPPSRDPAGLPAPFADRVPAGLVEVAHTEQVKLVGEDLRQRILRLLAQYPRIKRVRVEVNQGGDLWYTVLHNLPVPLLVHTSNASKEVRFAEALDYYQRLQVAHSQPMATCEGQMIGFPKVPHDDVADATVSGVLFFLSPPKVKKVTIRTQSYA